jgi:hypothetical protein
MWGRLGLRIQLDSRRRSARETRATAGKHTIHRSRRRDAIFTPEALCYPSPPLGAKRPTGTPEGLASATNGEHQHAPPFIRRTGCNTTTDTCGIEGLTSDGYLKLRGARYQGTVDILAP